MGAIVTGILSGVLSSLLTIYLAPRARHAFWSRERITELRLATYDKVNEITAALYVREPADSRLVPFGVDADLKELHTSFMTAHNEVRNRFSETALRAYEKLQVLVEANGIVRANRTSYSVARDAVLRQLHSESVAF